MSSVIRPLASDEGAACESILRALPEWFGIEQAIQDYVRDLQVMETWVAADGDQVLGVLTLCSHNEHAAEIHLLAVAPHAHGTGWGRRLVEHAEELLRARSVSLLQVKTLGPSRPDPNYERTRGFYARMGFLPLEENRLWGDANPCLILVKPLG